MATVYKYPQIRLLYDRRHEATRARGGAVTIRVSHGGRVRYVETGVRVPMGRWSEALGATGPGADALNAQIQARLAPMQAVVAKAQLSRQQITLDDVVMPLQDATASEGLVDYIARSIDARRDIRESTRRVQRKLVAALRRFGRLRRFADLTREGIAAFDRWLHNHEPAYKQSTIHSYHKFLKIYINMAIREGIISDNPYIAVRVDRGSSGERRYLSDRELAAIETCPDLPPRLCRIRDVFLVQCYTGLAYADLHILNEGRAVERGGRQVLTARRYKTGKDYYIVLRPEVLAILERYGGTLPLLTNQKYNDYLKVLATAAGLDIALSSHMGRHTFAVRMLNAGVKVEVLARMMGHTDIKTTQIYARIVDETVEAAFDALPPAAAAAAKDAPAAAGGWGWGEPVKYTY